ncbi:MAG: SPOR domain-containing protein [Succinivibrio sp.]|nr:SPOR domain-containing protein [Succinivibrio sp.]
MQNLGYSFPKSFVKCAKSLCEQFSYGDKWIFLSGDSGSGRTSICEHVVNTLEGKFNTIFIPCKDDLSLVALRKLFLQQIAPNLSWDEHKPLNQTVKELSLPTREKFLIVIDDIDSVINSFYEEVMDLYAQCKGIRRFSFLAVAHLLWTQNKLKDANNDKLDIKEICVPNLSLEEALLICQQRFVFSKLEKVYNTILPKLPNALASCEGNISKVIKLTEKLMSDPIEVNNENQDDLLKNKELEPKKKHNTTALFISIICLVIVIALLVPVFLGSNVVDKVLGSSDNKAEQAIETTATNTTETKKEQAIDPLAVSEGAVDNIKAEGPKGDEKNAAEDAGALLDHVDEGVALEGSKATTKNSVTLEGETLEAIEKKESKDPRQSVAGSVEQKKADTKAEVVTIARENNALKKAEIEKEDQEAALKQKALEEQFEQERQRSREAVLALDKEKVGSKALTIKAPVKEAKAQEPKTKAQNAVAKAPAKKTLPIPGAASELSSINPKHYTLQVSAGRSRAPLLQVADFVDGRYWIYQTTREGKPWYVLIMGDFLTAKEAMAKVSLLPQKIRKTGPFAKRFSKVQQEMSMR